MKKTPILLLVFLILISTAAHTQNYYEQAMKAYWHDSADMITVVNLFTKAIENKQEVAQSYMMRGSARRLLEQFSNAKKDLDISFQLDSTNYKIYQYYAKLYCDEGEYATAKDYYDRAISINPKAPELYGARAEMKGVLNDYQGTIADESMAISLDSTDYNAWLNRGFAKYKLKDYENALADLDKSVKLKPCHKGYADRGAILYEMKRYQKAIDDFTQALAILPVDYEVLYYRGLSYNGLNAKDKACQDFKKSKELGYAPASDELVKNHCD